MEEDIKEMIERHKRERQKEAKKMKLLVRLGIISASIGIMALILELIGVFKEAGIMIGLLGILVTLIIGILSTERINSTVNTEVGRLEETINKRFDQLEKILIEIRDRIQLPRGE